MRSLACWSGAALACGWWFSLGTVSAQENWRLPPTDREIWLVAHQQITPPAPLPPTPDENSPSFSDQALPAAPNPSWLAEDPAVNPAPACGSAEEALQAPNCGSDEVQFACCPPSWLVRAEAIVWDRSNSRTRLLATDGVNNLDSGNLNFDWRAGPRVTLQKQNLFGSNWGLEIGYFGIDGYSAAGALANATSINTTPNIFIGGANNTTALYSSRIYSSEINLRQAWNERLTFIHGFRWVELGERLQTSITIPGLTASNNINVNNHLYGYQLGADYRLWNGNERWFVDGVLKAGVYGNSADQDTTTTNVGGALPAIHADATRAAFLGEAGLYGGYRLTNSWRLMGGYNVLWLSGVADAPSQLATTNLVTGAATVSTSSSPSYHGATMGLEWVH